MKIFSLFIKSKEKNYHYGTMENNYQGYNYPYEK